MKHKEYVARNCQYTKTPQNSEWREKFSEYKQTKQSMIGCSKYPRKKKEKKNRLKISGEETFVVCACPQATDPQG